MDPNDTPERRRQQLAEQRAASQARLEAKRDEMIAKKREEKMMKDVNKVQKDLAPDPQQLVKVTTQNLIASMKKWVRLPRAIPPPDPADVAVNEKEIAALTVKLGGLAPNPELKRQLVANIKQLLLRGKIALKDGSDENLNALSAALKAVADDLKLFVTGQSPPPMKKAQHSQSSPSLPTPSRPKNSQPQTPSTPATYPSKRTPLPGSPRSDPPSESPAITPSVARRQLGLDRAATTDSVIEEAYDDGSPAPAASQDFATAMWEQREYFPKLEIPWQLDYLCNQIALRGGCVSEGQFDGMLPERKLQPYDETFQAGNLSWINEKDFLIPLSLLKRYFWHLPSATIPDKQEALDKVKQGSYSYEASQYVMDMPLHKRDVVCYVVAYIRKVKELRGGSSDVKDVIQVFAPLLFRSSSNYSSREHKMRIPAPLNDEVRFVSNIVRDLDVQAASKKGAKERARIVAAGGSKSGSSVTSAITEKDILAQRQRLQSWKTEDDLAPSIWTLPACSMCYERPANWKEAAEPCKKCKISYYKSAKTDEDETMRKQTSILSGFQYELGTNKISDSLQDKPSPTLELVYKQIHWYQEYFHGQPHLNIVAQERELKDGKATNIAVVSVQRPPENLTDSYPLQALVLHPDLGYVRVVVELQAKSTAGSRIGGRKGGTDVLSAVKSLPIIPNDARLITVDNPKLSDALADFEQKTVAFNYKFGLLYQAPGQTTEEEMYNNMDGSPNYHAFLNLIGETVTLGKHKGFRGGLECQGNNSTGEFSVYSKLLLNNDGTIAKEDKSDTMTLEIMWHVAHYLPDSQKEDNDRQQLQRKRHLGNDVVIVIFTECDQPFDPKSFASQFNHVWIVVSPVNQGRGIAKKYKVSVVSKTGVKPFRPFVPDPPVLMSGPEMRDWLLMKCVNAERAAMFAKDFKGKETRTRVKMMEHWEGSYLEKPMEKSWMGKLTDSSASLFASILGSE